LASKLEVRRSGCKKGQKPILKLEIESIDLQLSKSGLRISLRPLDRFLDNFEVCSNRQKIAFLMILGAN